MVDKNPSARNKNPERRKQKPERRKKKGKPKTGLYIALALIIGFPVIGLLGWYTMTAVLSVSGSQLSASQMISSGLESVEMALEDQSLNRARREGFSLENVDQCHEIIEQYQVIRDAPPAKQLIRTLIGLPVSATENEVNERCVLFAKVVQRMEKLAHHNKHLFMCRGSVFSADESSRFKILPDPQGRGLIESMSGRTVLVPIRKGTHKLIRQWQVFNVGGGCLVIGISSVGKFSLS